MPWKSYRGATAPTNWYSFHSQERRSRRTGKSSSTLPAMLPLATWCRYVLNELRPGPCKVAQLRYNRPIIRCIPVKIEEAFDDTSTISGRESASEKTMDGPGDSTSAVQPVGRGRDYQQEHTGYVP